MSEPTTRRELDGLAGMLFKLTGQPYYVEHATGGYTLYQGASRGGVRHILFGRSKSELYRLMHAYLDGLMEADRLRVEA